MELSRKFESVSDSTNEVNKKIRLHSEPSSEIYWKKDPGEKASKIWEWQSVRVHESKNANLSFFEKVIRVVVLTQLSSCAVERVFSQLKLIRDACRDSMM